MAYRNISINPFLRLIYFFLRAIVWVSLRVLYRRRLVLGREHLRFDGPAIVIVNHPSTLLDVLNPAVEIRQEMFFLANYGMFKNPVAGWFLRRFFCIPVMRKEDVAEGETRNNLQAFEQSFQHLEKNGVLFIAPEGTSWMNRFVRPLKTGTARIAFGAEARNDWKLDVKILPVGLSYTAPALFRSAVVVQFGAPVYARDWAEAWAADRNRAVQDFTDHLETQLKNLSIHAVDEAGERLLGQLETLWQNDEPRAQYAAFARSKNLAQGALLQPGLGAETQAYFDALQREGISDEVLIAATRDYPSWRMVGLGLVLLLGLPLFALGFAIWALPCFLPWWLNKKMGLYVGYSTTVKMLVGLFTFSPALWALYRLGHWASGSAGWSGWAAVAGGILLGVLAEQYLDIFKKFKTCLQAVQALRSRRTALVALYEMRIPLIRKTVHYI